MRTLWKDDLSRRSVLQLGIAGAALLAAPWPLQRKAQAQSAAPHFTVLFQADGGWDPTQVFDAHNPNDNTDNTATIPSVKQFQVFCMCRMINSAA